MLKSPQVVSKANLGSVPPVKTPSGATSQATYADIKNNIDDWIEEAIKNRDKYAK